MPDDIPQYPLLSESERPAATTDFVDGCLPDEDHRMIADIRGARPREYPNALAVIRSGIERVAREVRGGA